MKKSLSLKIFILLTLTLLVVVCFPKGQLVQKFNLFTAPDLFPLFKGITFFGDGLVLAVFVVFIIVFQKRIKALNQNDAYELLVASLLMFLIVSVMKNVFLFGIPRPIKFFEPLPENWRPEDFNLRFNRFRSFPSGHSATIAVMGFFILQHLNSKVLRVLLFFFVLLVGYSRMFLFQHFVIDVVCGLLLGLSCVLLAKKMVHHIALYRKKKKSENTLPGR